MSNAADSPTDFNGQALSLRSAGAILERADAADARAWDARAFAYDDLQPDAVVCKLGDECAATHKQLFHAKTTYRAVARAAAAKRRAPRLPAGIGPDVRAVVQAACNEMHRTRRQYDGLTIDNSTLRERIDVAAAREHAEQIFETLRDKFNARERAEQDAKAERDASAQARAFNWQQIEAARKRGVIVRRRWER
jgi:hypothetical protein